MSFLKKIFKRDGYAIPSKMNDADVFTDQMEQKESYNGVNRV